MKKIGFIDYFIDEWHANNYPAMIRASSFAGRMDVALAWDKITPAGKKPLADWCREQKVAQASSIEEVVASCDCLIVLSPDNAEMHEELADLPLRSGKPVYIDKPIAPNRAAAGRLFEKAAKHGTPMFSSSALRFGSALRQAADQTLAGKSVRCVNTRGGGLFHIYAIHQIEMLVELLGPGATRVMQAGVEAFPTLAIDYADGRRGVINLINGHPFQLSAGYLEDGQPRCLNIDAMNDFFPRFIEAMLAFFDTGRSPVPAGQTLEIAALIEAGTAALRSPGTWVNVPRG